MDHQEDETTLVRMVISASEGGVGEGYEGYLVLATQVPVLKADVRVGLGISQCFVH